LVEQLGVVAALGRVGELVGLLERVRNDRALVLLAVPGALAPQAARELVEPAQRLRDLGAGDPPDVKASCPAGRARCPAGRAPSAGRRRERRSRSSWASERSCSRW